MGVLRLAHLHSPSVRVPAQNGLGHLHRGDRFTREQHPGHWVFVLWGIYFCGIDGVDLEGLTIS